MIGFVRLLKKKDQLDFGMVVVVVVVMVAPAGVSSTFGDSILFSGVFFLIRFAEAGRTQDIDTWRWEHVVTNSLALNARGMKSVVWYTLS